MDLEHAIRARRTHKRYGDTPVDEDVVRELVELARLAPNHKLTNPWRFRLLGPDTRARIEALAGEKEAAKLRRAPTLLLVTALPSDDPVLTEENRHATAAAVYALLLAATSRGLASYWRTPALFREQPVRALLGLEPGETLIALVHLGPPAGEPPGKERAPVEEILSVLP